MRRFRIQNATHLIELNADFYKEADGIVVLFRREEGGDVDVGTIRGVSWIIEVDPPEPEPEPEPPPLRWYQYLFGLGVPVRS